MSTIVVIPTSRLIPSLLCFLPLFLASLPARADDEPDQQQAGYAGVVAGETTIDTKGLNAALARGGYGGFGTAANGASAVFAYRYDRTRIGVDFGVFGFTGTDDRVSGLRVLMMADVGYDAGRSRGWFLTPRIGLGSGIDRIELSGVPGSIADRGSRFDRFLSRADPGIGATSASFLVRPALMVGHEATNDDGIGYRVGAVLAYNLPIAKSAYSENWGARLDGPEPQHGSAFFGLELSFILGAPKEAHPEEHPR